MVIAVLLVSLPLSACHAAPSDPTISIITAEGKRCRFDVDVADSFESRERGLMFRKNLGPREGMLFVFEDVQPVTFWMKNTLIPLDMLFIDQTGRVVHIARNAQPLSTDLISSQYPVKWVLEIAGGEAARQGIDVGGKLVGVAGLTKTGF
jgi:hypothetical protein